nr:MAG TPA: hypothetical protein [Caudoviricetes sp.]
MHCPTVLLCPASFFEAGQRKAPSPLGLSHCPTFHTPART